MRRISILIEALIDLISCGDDRKKSTDTVTWYCPACRVRDGRNSWVSFCFFNTNDVPLVIHQITPNFFQSRQFSWIEVSMRTSSENWYWFDADEVRCRSGTGHSKYNKKSVLIHQDSTWIFKNFARRRFECSRGNDCLWIIETECCGKIGRHVWLNVDLNKRHLYQ